MNLLGLLRRTAPAARILPLDPANGPIYAVGDVHGCRQLLMRLLEAIRADAARHAGQPHVILLGDMVDRGPDSAGVLDILIRPLPWGRLSAIGGNHEAMMRAFLADPHSNAAWLAQGGFETLRSYGLSLEARDLAELSRRRVAQILTAHIPETHLAQLAALPDGHVLHLAGQAWVLAHAGFDPSRTIDRQERDTLLWGGPRPEGDPRLRLVHGHIIRDTVDLTRPSVGIDTGAWRTGCLSALRLSVDGPPAVISTMAAAA